MPYIKYIAPKLGPNGVTLDIPLSNKDLAGLRNRSTLNGIIEHKVRPFLFAYVIRAQYPCVVCQKLQATRMISNFAMHFNSPEGPVIIDHTPWPICESSKCNFEASRRAHEFRHEMASEMQGMGGKAKDMWDAAEGERCDNCEQVFNVREHGRLKRCARCHAKLYCSKRCQKQHWAVGHKFNCKPAADPHAPSPPTSSTSNKKNELAQPTSASPSSAVEETTEDWATLLERELAFHPTEEHASGEGGDRRSWPFIFFHDPATGMKDWQTWCIIGILICWCWSTDRKSVV